MLDGSKGDKRSDQMNFQIFTCQVFIGQFMLSNEKLEFVDKKFQAASVEILFFVSDILLAHLKEDLEICEGLHYEGILILL